GVGRLVQHDEAPGPRWRERELPRQPACAGLATLRELRRRDDGEADVTPVEGVLRARGALTVAEGGEDVATGGVLGDVVVAGSGEERLAAQEAGVGCEELVVQVGGAAAGVRHVAQVNQEGGTPGQDALREAGRGHAAVTAVAD